MELVAECPLVNAKECAERLSKLMSEVAEERLQIPITCDVDIMREWYGEKIEV